MAMASAEVGQYDDAMPWQREALEAAQRTGPRETIERLTDNLARHQACRPCCVPWRADEPIEF
jgi:hypothetical protein